MNLRKSKLCNFKSCYLCVRLYCNLSKIDPPLKISLHVSPFLIEVVAKGVLLSKVHPPFVAAVHAVMLNKNRQRSSIVQEEALTKEGRHHLHKQVHE